MDRGQDIHWSNQEQTAHYNLENNKTNYQRKDSEKARAMTQPTNHHNSDWTNIKQAIKQLRSSSPNSNQKVNIIQNMIKGIWFLSFHTSQAKANIANFHNFLIFLLFWAKHQLIMINSDQLFGNAPPTTNCSSEAMMQ